MKPTPENKQRILCTIAELSRRSGMTEAAIRSRISQGYWVEGTHFFKNGRRVMVDPQAINLFWVKSKR